MYLVIVYCNVNRVIRFIKIESDMLERFLLKASKRSWAGWLLQMGSCGDYIKLNPSVNS